ncbi:hypothetical protein HN588_07430 [Candidatus Bathyarchaeota archaeon]|nr:hypothetical protein [Candidatus Bathyarchaeota archaeon]
MPESIVQNTTCFAEHRARDLTCRKKSCRNWMACPAQLNCAVLAARREDTRTLQEIGDIFGVTRMRICQIEKAVMKKMREQVPDSQT